MSPIQALERSYAALKQLLRDGAFVPGFRLEASRLADEIGVSITPVRDALHRLVGERLIEASAGEGFHVPRLTEAELRDLYEWNSALLVIAVRTRRQGSPHILPPEDAVGVADCSAALFEAIGSATPNREIRVAIAAASDRLHAFRRLEPRILEATSVELEEIAQGGTHQLQAIRRYHLRRIRVVPALLRARAGG